LQSLRVKAGGWFRSAFPFTHKLWFYLGISIGCLGLLFRQKPGDSLPDGMKGFLLFLICLIWFSVGVLCIASVVVQLRYPFAYAFFVWPVFVYLLRMVVITRNEH